MLTFNKDSWHYRLATVYGPMYEWQDADICSYLRAVLFGLLASGFLAAFGFIVALGVLDFSLWIYFTYLGYSVDILGPAVLPIALGLVGIIYYLIHSLAKLTRVTANKSPSFVKEAYYSWKNKYCVKVDFK